MTGCQELQVALQTGGFRPYIFDCVMAEVISVLARRTQKAGP